MEKGGRLWQRKKVYQEKLTQKSSWTITLTGIIQTSKLTKPTRKTAVYRKTSGTILVFLKAKATVGVTTDHQSVSAEKRNVLLRHGKTRGVFFSDKYKRQRGSLKLSLPYLYMHFCNNRVKICGAVIKEKLRQNGTELFKVGLRFFNDVLLENYFLFFFDSAIHALCSHSI